jgi:hypothetical protein
MEGDFKKDTPISKFNDAVYQIGRLNNSWIKCDTYSKSGKLTQYKWELDVIWRELSADARKHNNWDKIKEIKDKINQKIAENQSDRHKFYHYLTLKEELLRWIQNLVGKGSKYGDEDEDMM